MTMSHIQVSQVALMVKNPPANAGDIIESGLIPGSGRSPGGGFLWPDSSFHFSTGKQSMSGYTTVYLSIHHLKDMLVISRI